jgi:hypothetical protein
MHASWPITLVGAVVDGLVGSVFAYRRGHRRT